MITKLNINAIENGIIPYEKLNNGIIEKINSKSDKTHTHDYLPLSGGTMSNDIDMNLHSIINTGIEIVENLPTEDLFDGRQVTYQGRLYTYHEEQWTSIADDLGGNPETHQEEFVYQPTAADLSIKDGFADIKKLKGNTIVWNQLIKSKNSTTNNGITFTNNNDGSYTVNGTATADTRIILYSIQSKRNPAKYLLKGCPAGGSNDTYYFGGMYIWTASFNKIDTGSGVIVNDNNSLDFTDSISINVKSGYTANNLIFKPQLFNLTKMFGEGNEPTTVEEFDAMFPKDYYEYNEGELRSFDGKGVKSVGFNQWDEELVLGYISNDGNNVNANDKVRTNYIKVLPNTTYYVSSNRNTNASIFISMYDNNKAFLRSKTALYKGAKITIDADVHYIRFYYYDETPSNIYNICINLSHTGYRNGEYKPYEDYTLSFQDGKTISQLTGKLNGEGESVTIFPDGLRSAGTAYDEIVYDEVTGKHKVIKRIGSVDLGVLNWTYNDGSSNPDNYPYGYFINHLTTRKPGIKTIICTKYPEHNNSFNKDKAIVPATLQSSIYIVDSSYTDADSLKASLQGQILYYELAEPEVYELDFPINTSYEAYDFGTEEVLYNDDKEVNIPMKANIEYNFNAVDMIRNNHFKIQNLKENLNELRTNSIPLLLEHDTRINNILVEIENNELVTATAITNLEDRTTNVENGLTNKSDIGHTHVSSAITDSIIAGRDITSSATGLVQGRAVYTYTAPANHASSATTYGVATTSDYGHVKIGSGLTVSDGVLSHPTTPGNRHIPSGGALGQCLKYNGFSGTVKWSDIFNYSKNALSYSPNITSPNHTSFICNESITIPSNSLCHVKLTVMSMGTSLLSLTPFGAKLYNETTIFDMAQGLLMPFVGGSPGQIDLWYFNNTSDDITEVNVSAYSNTNITLSSSLDGLIEGDVLPLASYYEIVSF